MRRPVATKAVAVEAPRQLRAGPGVRRLGRPPERQPESRMVVVPAVDDVAAARVAARGNLSVPERLVAVGQREIPALPRDGLGLAPDRRARAGPIRIATIARLRPYHEASGRHRPPVSSGGTSDRASSCIVDITLGYNVAPR